MDKPICKYFVSKNDKPAGCCNCGDQISDRCLEYWDDMKTWKFGMFSEVLRGEG